MDLNFSIDLDSQEIHIVVDNGLHVKAIKDDNEIKYVNFKRIDNEDLQDKLKHVCATLFTLDEC